MKPESYFLSNSNGVEIEFLSLGGKIKSIKIPNGQDKVDIALGYNKAEDYVLGDAYMGAICGRFANRIGMGRFNLNGQTIQLAQNDRTNHLHGGNIGFNALFWKVEKINLEKYVSSYKLNLLSADGDESYPGNLEVEVIYALNNKNEFHIDIKASADKPTPVNLTSHPYFNLNGVGNGKIFNHELWINAEAFTPLNDVSVPTGEIRSIKNTPMDFTNPVRLGDVINSAYEQINLVNGLDHNWVLKKGNDAMVKAAVLSEPESGRSIEVFTTQPGLQVYTSMHFDGTEPGKNQIPFTPYCAVAIEAQNFPDAPNKTHFPNSIINPGETYHEIIIYKFNF
ncbi:MAG: aldose epimerase family protein [Salinivirgaceae bacterium]